MGGPAVDLKELHVGWSDGHPCPPTRGSPTVLGAEGLPTHFLRFLCPLTPALLPGNTLQTQGSLLRLHVLAPDGPDHADGFQSHPEFPKPMFSPVHCLRPRSAMPPASGTFPTGHRGDRDKPELPPPSPLWFSAPPHPGGIQAQILDLPWDSPCPSPTVSLAPRL